MGPLGKVESVHRGAMASPTTVPVQEREGFVDLNALAVEQTKLYQPVYQPV